MKSQPAQSLSVKRAEVEFHKFASLGEPERVLRVYEEENERRRGLIVKHLDFIGPMTPFLEIGANAGHSSYMLANEFDAGGFALDLSADALRYGAVLRQAWSMSRSPVRIAGDALRLPFRDCSLRLVMAFQMLSQFMDIESVFVKVKRVLAPGGVFFFSEEPLRRLLSLRLYRCPYLEAMKPWERKLYEWGLLGYLVKDVIGAAQEEGFGIRQNHRLGLKQWQRLVERHFPEHRYEIFVPERGPAETLVKRLAVRLDPYRSVWRAARLLGGTFSAICRKPGTPEQPAYGPGRFERLLCCPDCRSELARDSSGTLSCNCGYQAPLEDGVYNLLPSSEKRELYPGAREDIVDFSVPGHERALGAGWHKLEGTYGNVYRWMEAYAWLQLKSTGYTAPRLRIRGFAPEAAFRHGEVNIEVRANGRPVCRKRLERNGLFVLEADLAPAPEYVIEIQASPVWQAPPDDRRLTVNISLVRLIEAEPKK